MDQAKLWETIMVSLLLWCYHGKSNYTSDARSISPILHMAYEIKYPQAFEYLFRDDSGFKKEIKKIVYGGGGFSKFIRDYAWEIFMRIVCWKKIFELKRSGSKHMLSFLVGIKKYRVKWKL